MFVRNFALVAAAALIVGACGSSDDDSPAAVATDAADIIATAPDAGEIIATAPDAGDLQDAADDLQEQVDEITDDLQETQDAIGGGGATLVANGQTWEFPSVLCAFGEDQIGQPGAVFNLSALGDGLQLYVSIDDNGESHSLSLNDIQNFENPSVALEMNRFFTGLAGVSEDFLVLDGKQVTAEVPLMDDVTGTVTPEPAQLTATCP